MAIFPPNTPARSPAIPRAAIARNWLKTLWEASFKGVPMKVERDLEVAGRRIAIHEFFHRDDPYLEDMGEGRREFHVIAYLASDAADTDAAALIAMSVTPGPGVLVLPAHGPIQARCLGAERRRDKDRHGYIAVTLHLVREGFGTALASVSMLANLTFAAADTLVGAAATAFASSIAISGQPGFVVVDTVSAIQDNLSALETVRTSERIDPIASAVQRNAILTAFNAAASLVETDPASTAQVVVTIARALGDAIPPATAVSAFESLSQLAPIGSVAGMTASARVASGNVAAAYLTLRIAALTAYCEAVVRTTLADRPAAITLRANVSEFFDAELDRLSADQVDLFNAMVALRDRVVDYLSRTIIDLAPIVSVSANLRLPSLYWAWRLYADPTRSAELVARNKVVHPSIMPTDFEALAN